MDLGGKWAQLGVGVSGEIKPKVNLFVSADYNQHLGGQKSRGITGRVGLKMAW